MFVQDLKRGLFNLRFLFVFMVSVLLFFVSDYQNIFSIATFADLKAADLAGESKAVHFIESNGHNKYQVWLQSFQFTYFLFPLLVILPYSTIMFTERTTRYFIFIKTRMTQASYIRQKFWGVFSVGGLSIFVPEVFYYFVLSLLFKSEKLSDPLFTPMGPLASWFETWPELYVWSVMCFHFVLGGVFAVFGLMFSLFVKKKAAAYLLPYLALLGASIGFEAFLGWFSSSPLQWIQFMYSYHLEEQTLAIWLFVLLAASRGIIEVKLRRMRRLNG